jgi:hypothetical protein
VLPERLRPEIGSRRHDRHRPLATRHLTIRLLSALSICLLVLVAGCGGSGNPLPGWDVVAKGKENDAGILVATGTIKNPTGVAIRVGGKSDDEAQLTYTLDCAGQTQSSDTKVTVPLTTTMSVPPGNPPSCSIKADLAKPPSGKVSLTVYAQSAPSPAE